MAGRRVYGGSNMAMLLQGGGMSREAIEGLLASGSSPSFHGSRTMVSFENARGSTPEQSLCRQTGDDDPDECFNQPEKKRRLTTDQVQFLERSFEKENKLEPERKVQLAKDLGLQPRQVAIWFQNRRVRWKTKQLEKDYDALKSSYNNLKADYDNLLEEEEKLKAEVTLLTEKLHLREKGKNDSETHEPKNQMLPQQVTKPDPDSAPDVQQAYALPLVGKQEDISSANSAVFDCDSRHHSDGGRRSPLPEPAGCSAFEQDHSDLSHAEEDEKEKMMYHFPKLEDSSCNYEFPVVDQPFWFWPAY